MSRPNAPAAPPVRVHEFVEHRVRQQVRGSLTDEHVDHLITEPVASQLHRWLSRSEHFVMAPHVRHNTLTMPDGSRMITVAYMVMAASKGDVVQSVYGV